jgi:hypothetical protein
MRRTDIADSIDGFQIQMDIVLLKINFLILTAAMGATTVTVLAINWLSRSIQKTAALADSNPI